MKYYKIAFLVVLIFILNACATYKAQYAEENEVAVEVAEKKVPFFKTGKQVDPLYGGKMKSRGHVDSTKPGMPEPLGASKSNPHPIDDFGFWAMSQQTLLANHTSEDVKAMLDQKVNLWKVLKAPTDPRSDSRKIIMGVGRENGLDASQRLQQRFR